MRIHPKERIGVYKSALIFDEELGWIFREQPILDVGIDALIEEAFEGNPTGKFLASQIKTGKGNFYESVDSLTLYVSNVHYYYWLNLNLPIIIVAHIPEENYTCWEHISNETLIKTESQWKIIISKHKLLNRDAKLALQAIVKSQSTDEFISQLLRGEINSDIIDQIVLDSEDFINSHKDLEQMTAILEEFTAGLTKYTAKITHLVNKGQNIRNTYVKKNIEDAASFMNKNADRLNTEIENFSMRFSKGFRASEKLCTTYFELTQDYQGLRALYDNVNNFIAVMTETIKSTIQMRDNASAIPSDNNKMAKARKHWIDACNNIIHEFKVAKNMTTNLHIWMNEKLN